MDDIEDMIGEEELDRVAVNSVRTPMVAPKPHFQDTIKTSAASSTASSSSDFDTKEPSVPGTQLIWIKTYGCSHNVSDSEYMQGILASYGYRFTQDPDAAQLWLLNSCTVKDPSQAAFMHLAVKGRKQNKAVVVAGCVPQADRHLKGLEEVSIVGIQQVDRVVEVVEETLKGHTVRLLVKNRLPELDLPKIRKNPMVEIIPLSTGCLGACTYCKTRHARGKLGSYTPEAIVSRAQTVINEGVTEIWLSSEDTGAYGIDIGTDLPTLMRKLLEVVPDGVMLRVGMTNPPYILDHLDAIAEVLNHDRVYSFLHVPVQSGSDDVLLAMNREYTAGEFRRVADELLAKVPDLTLATDIICGFPTETEEHFDETMELVAKYRFHIMNISQFYPRPGTPAAKMKRVPTQVVKNRSRKLTKLFETFEPYTHHVGTTQKVWVNTEVSDDKKYTVAHTKNYTKVLLPRDDSLIGCTAEVRVLTAARFHITGEVISRSQPCTVASAAIREQIRTEGELSAADRAKALSKAKAGGHSHGHDHEGDEDHHGEGGCCGGSGSCCSSGGDGKDCGGKCSTKKKKKTVVKESSRKKKHPAAGENGVVSTITTMLAATWSQVSDDKVTFVALTTLVVSASFVVARLLTRK
ncbi:Threonylcarbamoyladenosine tRNA methylthiotransferase [Phytophthora idaei]|nr:Threonylcarbamoyladenosine tRNA methylthiotransferase [Phytophthora idaei]KAG3149422.1 Threonylcarbamoyladenosine tRNA methylthiotransferase [Phytophthora idaei]KAG3241140.1 Threonylcarbamoyladenosine tRNA methylthiotransferase [Phytophthora idaei]